jgi:hypothetical protein
MEGEEARRKELKAKLRRQIRNKRDGHIPAPAPLDPTSLLMQLGMDDASVLSKAGEIAKRPHQILRELKSGGKEEVSLGEVGASSDADEEEAPPPFDRASCI